MNKKETEQFHLLTSNILQGLVQGFPLSSLRYAKQRRALVKVAIKMTDMLLSETEKVHGTSR